MAGRRRALSRRRATDARFPEQEGTEATHGEDRLRKACAAVAVCVAELAWRGEHTAAIELATADLQRTGLTAAERP